MTFPQGLIQNQLSQVAGVTLRYVQDSHGKDCYVGDFSSEAYRRLKDAGMHEHWLNAELGKEYVSLELDGIVVELD